MFATVMLGTMLMLPLSGGTETDPVSPGAAIDPIQRKCLERAVLIESTIPQESLLGQMMNAYVFVMRTKDGRWGATLCQTVEMRYASTRRITIRKRINRKMRIVVHTVVQYTCDVTSFCLKRFGAVQGTQAQRSMAHFAVLEVLSGNFIPPDTLKESLHYRYPAKSDRRGTSWFDCVNEELHKAEERDYHIYYKDADEATLAQRYAEIPKCRIDIDRVREAKSRKKSKTPPAETVEIPKTPET